jgi:hypothetical protein
MNAAIFVIDTLQAARDGLVLAGNAPQQADDARRGAVAGVASILCVYRRISEEAILPALRREGLLTPEVQAAWAELRDVAEMAVASADSGGSRTVPAPVSLVDRFEAAAMRQEMVMIPAIRRLPPDVLASLADRVLGIRLGHRDAT